MKRDVFLSIALHVMVILLTVMSSPFDYQKQFDYDQVIRIKAVAMPDFAPSPAGVEEIPASTPVIPQAVEEDLPEIPLDDPTTIDTPKEIKKPESKPKPAKETKKPKPQNQTKTTTEPSSGSGTGQNDKEIDVEATGSGSPFGGAKIDNASFNYPYWFTQAFNKIAGNWRQTVSIDGSVVCVIYFQVIRSGRVVDVEIKESSGVPAFDQTCLSAVERSTPFPPLPRDFRDEIIGITLPFKYQPR